MPRSSASNRKPTPAVVVVGSKASQSRFDEQHSNEQFHDEQDKRYSAEVILSARNPATSTKGSGSGRGSGYGENLTYGTGDVLYANTTNYEGLDKYFREYKRCSLTRQCIDIKALWASKEGFTTLLDWVDPTKQVGTLESYADAKAYVDSANMKVNFDSVTRSAFIMSRISGVAAFLIQYGEQDAEGVKHPSSLIELEPWDLDPKLSVEDGQVEKWQYSGLKLTKVEDPVYGENFIGADRLLTFTSSTILQEAVGLSEIEPVIDTIETRRYMLQEAYKETVKSQWAPAGLLVFDTGNQSKSEAQANMGAILDKTVLAPGKFIGINQAVEFQKLDIRANLAELIATKNDLDNEILGNFQVPRQLLNRSGSGGGGLSIGSAEFETVAKMFINGPIADMQKQLARQIEARWYQPLLEQYLIQKGRLKEGEPCPVKLKHIWNENKISETHTTPQPEDQTPPAPGQFKPEGDKAKAAEKGEKGKPAPDSFKPGANQ